VNIGVKELFSELQTMGIKKGIFSGGFVPILERFSQNYPLDFFEANVLEEKNGLITGNLLGRIIDKESKKELLTQYSHVYKIPTENCIAIGDGSNDALMLNRANIGIGFHPKEGLKKQILNWIDFAAIDSILFLFV